ncbi:hypothetical protein RISK_000321 [Rhodopirellula islandica]|uniref:Uncharacterized protein n=1 Tax=Rhodopirellula islandica TaxID=595434 RepID=A0A0J1EQ82_RHOIS|nr:hypothetical protein RISK_000321 [Rhodopirellula islandica]
MTTFHDRRSNWLRIRRGIDFAASSLRTHQLPQGVSAELVHAQDCPYSSGGCK